MLFVKNSVLMFNFFCFDAWILISNEESDENNVWFGYDIQNTCGFHLGFHWVSKLMHVTNLAIFYWLSNVWIINEFEKVLYSEWNNAWQSLNLAHCSSRKNYDLFFHLRTFAPKNFPRTDFFKTLTAGRKWSDYIKNVKKIGGHRTRFEDKA